jgi:SEC-C motif-containing protein
MMRISREDKVIGEWPEVEVLRRIEDERLGPTDCYYDEDLADWIPLSAFLERRASAPRPEKGMARLCYCGSGLPFSVCHGDDKKY